VQRRKTVRFRAIACEEEESRKPSKFDLFDPSTAELVEFTTAKNLRHTDPVARFDLSLQENSAPLAAAMKSLDDTIKAHYINPSAPVKEGKKKRKARDGGTGRQGRGTPASEEAEERGRGKVSSRPPSWTSWRKRTPSYCKRKRSWLRKLRS